MVHLLNLLVVLAFLPATVARAGAPAADRLARLDQYLAEYVKAAGLPGASAAVVYRDRTLFLKGYGVRDLKNGEPVTSETVYPTGSNGKSFTGTAILQLVEQGKVKLDDSVKQYIPWFELAGRAEADKITIRHLLSHTSGLRRSAHTVVWQDPRRIRPSLAEGVRALRTERLWSEPWARYEYSNMNYVVLGRVVEVASGLSFEAYVRQYILDPLGMQQTSLGGSVPAGTVAATNYGRLFGFLRAVPPLAKEPWQEPAGMGVSTAADVTRYLSAHMGYGPVKLLSAEGVKEIRSGGARFDDWSGYNAGWARVKLDGVPVLTHSGNDGGGHSVWTILPEQEMGLVLLGGADNDLVDALAEDAVRILLGQEPLGLAERRDSSRQRGLMALAYAIGALVALAWLLRSVRLALRGAARVFARWAVWTRVAVWVPLTAYVYYAGFWQILTGQWAPVWEPWPRALRGWAIDSAIVTWTWAVLSVTALMYSLVMLLAAPRAVTRAEANATPWIRLTRARHGNKMSIDR